MPFDALRPGFDKLSMIGKVISFEQITVRPEVLEGGISDLGNNLLTYDLYL